MDFKDDGTGVRCISYYYYDKCAGLFKDNGDGTCIPLKDPCTGNFRSDGTDFKCIPSGGDCAYGFKKDGMGSCIGIMDPCPVNFRNDGHGLECIPN